MTAGVIKRIRSVLQQGETVYHGERNIDLRTSSLKGSSTSPSALLFGQSPSLVSLSLYRCNLIGDEVVAAMEDTVPDWG